MATGQWTVNCEIKPNLPLQHLYGAEKQIFSASHLAATDKASSEAQHSGYQCVCVRVCVCVCVTAVGFSMGHLLTAEAVVCC